MYVITMKKEAMDLRESKERYMGGFVRRKVRGIRCKYMIVSKNKSN